MASNPYKAFIPYTVGPETFEALERINVRTALNGEAHGISGHLIAGDPPGNAWRKIGIVENLLEEGPVVSVTAGTYLVAVQHNERILPGAVRDEHLLKRVAELRQREDREPTKKEYAQLRDAVEAELLPKAFVRRTMVYCLFADRDKLFVFTSSAKRADDTIEVLHEAIGLVDLKLIGAHTKISPTTLIENIAKDATYYAEFEAGDSVVLKRGDKPTIRIKDRDTYGDEVQKLMGEYDVIELRVHWNDAANKVDEPELRFTLNDKLVFKGIKFTDFALKREEQDNAKDGSERASEIATALIVADTYSRMLKSVMFHLSEEL